MTCTESPGHFIGSGKLGLLLTSSYAGDSEPGPWPLRKHLANLHEEGRDGGQLVVQGAGDDSRSLVLVLAKHQAVPHHACSSARP